MFDMLEIFSRLLACRPPIGPCWLYGLQTVGSEPLCTAYGVE